MVKKNIHKCCTVHKVFNVVLILVLLLFQDGLQEA